MTREFEKCFPLPWKIVRREVAYEQGYGETFYSLCLGDRVIPLCTLGVWKSEQRRKSTFGCFRVPHDMRKPHTGGGEACKTRP